MIYVVIDTQRLNRVMLVKALDKDVVQERLRLRDTEKIVGSFTDNEISVLNTSSFAVIGG